MKKELTAVLEKIKIEFLEKFPKGKIFYEYFSQTDEWIFSIDKTTIKNEEFLVWSLSQCDSLWSSKINNVSFAEMSREEFNNTVFEKLYKDIWLAQTKTITIDSKNAIGLIAGVFLNVGNGVVGNFGNQKALDAEDLHISYKGNPDITYSIYRDDKLLDEVDFCEEGLAA